MQPKSSLLFSQALGTFPFPSRVNSVHASRTVFRRSVSILSSHIRLQDVLLKVQGAEEYPTRNTYTGGELDWSHFALKLPSTTGY
jgi:hypothetical protein